MAVLDSLIFYCANEFSTLKNTPKTGLSTFSEWDSNPPTWYLFNFAPNFASVDAGVAIAGGGREQGSRGPAAAAGFTTTTGAGAGGARDRTSGERTEHHDPTAGQLVRD